MKLLVTNPDFLNPLWWASLDGLDRETVPVEILELASCEIAYVMPERVASVLAFAEQLPGWEGPDPNARHPFSIVESLNQSDQT